MADDPMGVAPVGDTEEELRSQCTRMRREVDSLLQQHKPIQALAEALRKPPYAAVQPGVKDEVAQAVLKALGAFREADIRGAVTSLGEEEASALMKYLYRFWGSSLPARTNAQLLTWHAALVEHSGEGAIIRAVYDWRCV
mmetsp:Transcript_18749/g.41101  ORF Transcript_18749/g.41101 Transcript_18749/m.41101 type:complete len:140 (+) Transcript_18749:120-539(+)